MPSLASAGVILTSGANGRSSWEFTAFRIGPSTNGVGMGAFAQRDFKRGECIIAERPLATIVVSNRKAVDSQTMGRKLNQMLGTLSKVQHASFFGLSQLPDGGIAGLPHSLEAAYGIWMTNAYPTTNGVGEGGDGQAVFEQICRLQHACHPNTHLAWNAGLGAQTCHAADDIKQGDELMTAYWDDECSGGQSRAERQQRTSERFGFTCACATCRLCGEASSLSDRRQHQIRVLNGIIRDSTVSGDASSQDMSKHERLCASVRRLVGLLRDESMPGAWSREPKLSAAISATHHGDWAATRRWALDAAQCARDSAGVDSDRYRSIVQTHLRDYHTYGGGTWARVHSAVFGGFDVVACRAISEGEVVMSEQPLLAATAPGQAAHGWARASLKAFCDAPTEVQRAVLAISAVGLAEASTTHETSLVADARAEVESCADQPWRRQHPAVDDATLIRVCLIFQLYGYEFGNGLSALFELGCMMNHSCDANVRYSSTEQPGRGCYVARHAIAAGESLCTNYLGEYAHIMSTPARRDALLASKLFTCMCLKCRLPADALRQVPCPRCHPREGAERELPSEVAFERVAVQYAQPSSADPGASWVCGRCGAAPAWRADQVLQIPSSVTGCAGREWERVIENHVLHLDARVAEELSRSECTPSTKADAMRWYDLVVRNLGSRHWTSKRLAELVETLQHR